VDASTTFARLDHYIYQQLWRMLRRRHPNKSKGWLVRKYWATTGRKWVFAATATTRKGKQLYPVSRLCSLGGQRYIKVKADAKPYLPEYGRYFWRRRHDKKGKILPARSAWANAAGALTQ
jgi:RNA-directed DNA polymerase